MTAPDRASLAAVAERVLSLVDAGAEAQVVVRGGDTALTRFAGSFIHQNVAETSTDISLRVTLDGATARATTDQVDDDALRSLVRRATDAARVRPADPHWPGLTPPGDSVPDGGPTGVFDDATAEATPDDRAALVRGFVDACSGLETAGFASSYGVAAFYANSAGAQAYGRSTSATLDGIARTGRSDGSARATSTRIADLDGASIGAVAAAKARDSADATDIEPGRYEVVLEPSCVADILLFLDVYGLNGRAHFEGTSFAVLGEQQFDSSIDLWDDATDPRLPGVPFDDEGTAKRRVDLIVDGVTTAVVHDRRTAAMAGATTTGHAIAGGESIGAVATSLVLGAGDTSSEQLVADMERGLLVTDFNYTRILDPRTQVVTGLTRNGVFLVENGKVVRPVTNLRFTQSYVAALAPGQVLGVGSDLRLVETQFEFPIAVPSLRLASWNFSGGAKG
jgi:predicted Zn-dependent protease